MEPSIANIYCVGRNFMSHAKELNNPVPKEPLIFMKPSHAGVLLSGQCLSLPGDKGAVHYEGELVLRIGRDFQPGVTADDMIDGIALGIDFTLRDLQGQLAKTGQPWLAAKGFLRSAALTRFIHFPGLEACGLNDFTLRLNDEVVQRGNIGQMIFSPAELINFCGMRYGLSAGDLLFTGTPAGVGPVKDGDRLALFWGGERLGHCTVALE
ncbi:MAG: fumarylacetoacetate hydrolase family protein [Sporolactobacillus sp.]